MIKLIQQILNAMQRKQKYIIQLRQMLAIYNYHLTNETERWLSWEVI